MSVLDNLPPPTKDTTSVLDDLPPPQIGTPLASDDASWSDQYNALATRSSELQHRAELEGAANAAAIVPQTLKALGTNNLETEGDLDLGMPKLDADGNPYRANRPEKKDTAPYTKPKLSDFVSGDKWKEAAHYFADYMNMARPNGPAEQIPSDLISGATTGALSAPIGGAEAIVPNMLSGASATAAQQIAGAAGAGPTGQAIASTIGGMAPAGAGAVVKGAVRGSSGAQMAQNLENSRLAGVPITAGAAAESPKLSAVETASSKLPGGGPIRDVRGHAGANANKAVDDIVENLSPGTTKTNMEAGAAINEGAHNTRLQQARDEDVAYKKVEALVPKDTKMPADKLEEVLHNVTHETGIPEIDDWLATNRAKSANKAVASATAFEKPPAVTSPYSSDFDAVQHQPPLEKQQLTYGALRAMRSKVGESIDWGFSGANKPGVNADLKKIYGALSEDLKSGVTAVSPQARQAMDDANALYKANSAKRELLDRIVEKAGGEEAVFKAATNGSASGATKVSAVMNAMPPGDQNLFRATVLDQLGRKGKKADQDFAADRFLDQWKNLAPETKNVMFGTSGRSSDLRNRLDALTSTLDLLKKRGVLQSSSALSAGASAAHIGAVGGIGGLLGGLIGHYGAGAIVTHPVAAGAAAVGLMANPIVARAITNPDVVGWMARTARLPPAAWANALNQLANMPNPTAKELAKTLNEAQ